GIAAPGQVALVQEQITGTTVTLVPEHRLDEAHFEAAPGVEHAEAVGRDAPRGIAEPGRRLAVTERGWKAGEGDSAEQLAGATLARWSATFANRDVGTAPATQAEVPCAMLSATSRARWRGVRHGG